MLLDRLLEADRYSPEGLLRRYARARRRSFRIRQLVILTGAVNIALLASPGLGMLVAILALIGDGVDCLLLGAVVGHLEKGASAPSQHWRALVGAGVNGVCIAVCIMLTWQFLPVAGANFFAAALLMGAVMSVGMIRPLFRPGADIRLALFAGTALSMMALDLSQVSSADAASHGFFAAAVALLAYIAVLFMEFVDGHHVRRRETIMALLSEKQALETSRGDLAAEAAISQRLALVAKYANDSVIFADATGRIEWVNDAFTRISGYSFDEAVGSLAATLLNAAETDPDTVRNIALARSEGKPIRLEILNRTRTGGTVWMETSLIPVFTAQGEFELTIAVERDITQMKERETELARARRAAEESARTKSEFLANMSHEIRTPMNGVIGVAELLAETRLTRAQRDYVETIRDSGFALMAIINDVLDLAKLQAGKGAPLSEPFSVTDSIAAVLRILQPTALKKRLNLRFQPPSGGMNALGDEGKLRQILLNLVGNALKFTQTGDVTVHLHRPDPDDPDLVEIGVEDSGIGIPPDRLDAIFESFAQADSGVSRQFGGTGLGLTISSMLAAQMGGGISVRSELGEGSVFTVTLRFPALRDVSSIRQFTRDVPALPPNLRILAAEDNRTNMMILRMMLQGHVASLQEACNGAEALAACLSDPPDLILMDISMPVMDGFQALAAIRAEQVARRLPRCPVLALTANASGEDRAACLAAGFDGFLTKPLSRADLFAAIARHSAPVIPLRAASGL